VIQTIVLEPEIPENWPATAASILNV
jgi:hypothetical protein